MKQEMIQLEQAYTSIMEQAKKRNNTQLTQGEEGRAAASGVLVWIKSSQVQIDDFVNEKGNQTIGESKMENSGK